MQADCSGMAKCSRNRRVYLCDQLYFCPHVWLFILTFLLQSYSTSLHSANRVQSLSSSTKLSWQKPWMYDVFIRLVQLNLSVYVVDIDEPLMEVKSSTNERNIYTENTNTSYMLWMNDENRLNHFLRESDTKYLIFNPRTRFVIISRHISSHKMHTIFRVIWNKYHVHRLIAYDYRLHKIIAFNFLYDQMKVFNVTDIDQILEYTYAPKKKT